MLRAISDPFAVGVKNIKAKERMIDLQDSIPRMTLLSKTQHQISILKGGY